MRTTVCLFTLLTFTIVLLNCFKVQSQYRRMYIGDKVPMEKIVFNDIHNYVKKKALFSDFKGKFIVLDFWTKYCSVCIASFPHMEKLQEQFRNDLQVLLITKNTNEELAELMERSPVLKRTKLPMIIGDSILSKVIFPHGSVPYHVWLDREGNVMATTYAQETNPENLNRLIDGKALNILVKEEIFDNDILKNCVDSKKSLLEIGDNLFINKIRFFAQILTPKLPNSISDKGLTSKSGFTTKRNQNIYLFTPYYSFFTNYVPGDLPNGYSRLENSLLYDDSGNPRGLKIINRRIENFYKDAFVDSGVTVSKIILDEKAKPVFEDITDSTNLKRHLINHSYCYESSLPDYSFQWARNLLQLDLVRTFGIVGSVEDRIVNCLVVSRLGNKEKENQLWEEDRNENLSDSINKSGQDNLYVNTTINGIIEILTLNNSSFEDPVILDETNFTSYEKYRKTLNVKFNCKIKYNIKTFSEIQREFSKYGIKIELQKRKMKVLVLRGVM